MGDTKGQVDGNKEGKENTSRMRVEISLSPWFHLGRRAPGPCKLAARVKIGEVEALGFARGPGGERVVGVGEVLVEGRDVVPELAVRVRVACALEPGERQEVVLLVTRASAGRASRQEGQARIDVRPVARAVRVRGDARVVVVPRLVEGHEALVSEETAVGDETVGEGVEDPEDGVL